jgi:acyl-CoA synthetase (AMP-forming)/AMP-acid ligase II
MNLAAILARAASIYPNRQAVCCDDLYFTYFEFAARVGRLAGVLANEGVGPDAPLAILHRNCHRYLEAYFAAAALDTFSVPLNYRLTDRELSSILSQSGARCLVAADDFSPRACNITASLSDQDELRVLCWEDGPDALEARMAGQEAVLPESTARRDDPAQLYYTSGTTGQPKGVVLTHGNVVAHAMAAVEELKLAENDTWLHAAPMFHLADAWATWAVTWVGGRHVMAQTFEPERIFDLIADQNVTITNLIPTMLVDLVHHPEANPDKLKSMRAILSGGAPMAPDLLERIEQLFPCEYVQTYGLTETSPYLTLSLLTDKLRRLPPDEQRRYRASTGRPMLGVDLQVFDDKGTKVPWDGQSVGEIVARGPTVSPGYFQQPEATAAAYRDGWLHTGDLAFVDPEGYLTIVDRIKDVINTGGELVYSTEVENVLFRHADVQEAAVIAVPDSRWGEAVHAEVVLRKGRSCTIDTLLEHCREQLAAFKLPRTIAMRESLPRTGSGKIDKKAIREPHWRDEDKRVK